MPIAIRTTGITAGLIVATILWLWGVFLLQARGELTDQIRSASAAWDSAHTKATAQSTSEDGPIVALTDGVTNIGN